MFNNKTILVTGGTGSFGEAFIRGVYTKYKPKKLIVYSRDEYKQHMLSKKFKKPKYKGIRFFIGDVRDKNRLSSALKNVDLVIHAAALKHVPIAEYNPQECIKTNILGAQNLIDCCIENNVKKVIALSTDKAASPINLYGATKLVADKLFVSSNTLSAHADTIFSVVRYGNVLNSRGSVIPFFKDLAKKKQPLPLTDIDMTRFFISIEDAVNFIINCFSKMQGGEIFIPKLPTIKIEDLANSIKSIKKNKIVGLRPGEKLHEELCTSDDSSFTYENKNSYLIVPAIELPDKNIKPRKLKGYKKVKKGFAYSSLTNPNYLSLAQIKKIT
jgi:UDP-N-acetylglucosamine 4,6-dehydratase